MVWKHTERHEVGSYDFHWFSNGDGAWIVGIWPNDDAPGSPTEGDLARALTVHHISATENPTGCSKPVRQFCERFMGDIPFRVRTIRSKVPTLRTLERMGALDTETDDA